MHRLAFRVVQIDGSALVVVTLDLTQMHAQVVTELAELCFAGVLKAKFECCRKDDQVLVTAAGTLSSMCFPAELFDFFRFTTLLGNVMVQALHLGVVSQEVQALTVRLPQELHPRSE